MSIGLRNELMLKEIARKFKWEMDDCSKLLMPLQRIVVVDMHRALMKRKFGQKSLYAYRDYLAKHNYRTIFEL